MVPSHRISALAAASILSLFSAASAQTLSTPTYTGALAAMTAKGCFSDPTPLVDHGLYIYQTTGNCQPICVGFDMPVMGLVNGTSCWCGSEIPSKDSQVSDNECSTPCSGYDKDTCGGANLWQVWLTGSTQNKIPYYSDSSSSSSSSKTTAKAGEAVTSIVQGGTTIIKTIQGGAATSGSSSSGGGGSSNTAGIAAGVVVGVVALAAIVGGTFLYLRYRRRKAVEESTGGRPQSATLLVVESLHTPATLP